MSLADKIPMRALGYSVRPPADPADCASWTMHPPHDSETVWLAKDEAEGWEKAAEHWHDKNIAASLASIRQSSPPAVEGEANQSLADELGELALKHGAIEVDLMGEGLAWRLPGGLSWTPIRQSSPPAVEGEIAALVERDEDGRLLVCVGCGSSHTLANLQANGALSCCPERKMMTVFDALASRDAEIAELMAVSDQFNGIIEDRHAELASLKQELAGTRDSLTTLSRQLTIVEAAVEPVRHWYESDEHPPRELAAIVADAVADLQEDRAEVLRLTKAVRTLLDPPKHVSWGAGEANCPPDIKAPNGELHTFRCKVCGVDNPRDDRCLNRAFLTPDTEGAADGE